MTDEELRLLIDFVLIGSDAKLMVVQNINHFSFYCGIQL